MAEASAAMAADGGRFQCVTGGSSGAAACFFF